ncbi:phosphatase PAP2 family protein [Streptosporangium sp. NPDC051023]|uniref:phosphatase PAP2 family protein n=1 Tax=Streptosporangium sp. NPDC051023 TaxID=3155410 RepID=UPI00344EC02B
MRVRSWLSALDRRVFAAVADAKLPGLERLLPVLTRAADNSLLWAGLAGGGALSGHRGLRRAATRGLLAVSLASPLVNLVGKQAFRRQRPSPEGLPLARLIKMPTSASFPSGHSASAAAFATAVALEAPLVVTAPVALLAAAVCFSRVYTGVHYPGDVLAGAGVGVAAGLLTRRLWPRAAEAGRAGGAVWRRRTGPGTSPPVGRAAGTAAFDGLDVGFPAGGTGLIGVDGSGAPAGRFRSRRNHPYAGP